MKDLHNYGMRFDIRLKSFENDQIHDIKDFYINNEKDNKFISDFKDYDFNFDDAQYFIVTGKVFKDIVKQLCEENYQKGLLDSKKKKTTEE
jgi:hypothetical protein